MYTISDQRFSNNTAWLSMTRVAHRLHLRLQNSTWSHSLVFPPSDQGRWSLSIDIEKIFGMGRGHGSDLMEDFLYTVELDTGMYQAHGTIMFYHRQVGV